jgi:hypothetical protein
MNTGMEEKVVHHGLEVVAGDIAASDGLPGPLIGIFEQGDIVCCDGKIKVRKLYPTDIPVFKMINSPVYQMMLESAKPKAMQGDVETTSDDEFMMVLQFTLLPKEAYLLARKGREAFLDAAVDAALNMEIDEPSQVIEAVMQQITRAFKTKVNYTADDSGGGNGEERPLIQPSAVR